MKLLKLSLRLVKSRSTDPDIARQEFILNIFTTAMAALLFVATISTTASYLFYSTAATRANNRLSFGVLFLLLAFFTSLLVLSRRGFVRLASYLLLAVLFLFALYMSYRWGIDLQAALLFDVLVIVMTGILINTSSAFYMTAAVCLSIFVLGMFQHEGILAANRYWTLKDWNVLDIIVASAILAVIAVVSWLSNREIERSLKRARVSESALRDERDQLEIRVEERTDALRRAQMEQMTQAYRFVEFGRLAGGLFHELGNPLSALSLDIENIADSHERGAALETFGKDVARARRAAARMQSLMDSMRRHLARESPKESFSIPDALVEISRILESYARSHAVRISVQTSGSFRTYGDLTAFTQALTSIVSNAIEAYPPESSDAPREVHIDAGEENGTVRISVRDFGAGIPEDVREKIFEPFFTTKGALRGLGIGLPLAQRVVEKEFGGGIVVHSPPDGGSLFVLSFPLRGHES